MKNLTALLQSGDLKPRERVLLLVQNYVAKDKTGKEILTETDKYALCEGWRPKDNNEVKEYNKYNDGWEAMGPAALDAQMAYLQAQIAYYSKQCLTYNLLSYPSHCEMRTMIKRISETKCVTVPEAMAIVEKQRTLKLQQGFDYNYAQYLLAFESLSDEDKESFIELYSDIEIDHQYLEQEEIIANLLDGKDALTQKNKEKLADLVAGTCYNKFAEAYQLSHYFACIPLAEVARHFLIDNGIAVNGKLLAKNQECDDEDSETHDMIQEAVEKYAKENNITIEVILKEACLKWLDEDLFEQYTPLVLSNDGELFEKWLTTKSKAGAMLQKLIDKGTLKVVKQKADKTQSDTRGVPVKKSVQMGADLLGIKPESDAADDLQYPPIGDRTITGESLYAYKGDYKFVTDFKRNVDTYTPNLGLVYADEDQTQQSDHLDQELLIADKNETGKLSASSMLGIAASIVRARFESDVFFKETEKDGETIFEFKNKILEAIFIEAKDELAKQYATLLSFNELFTILSKIYEVDLTYRLKPWLDVLEKFIDQHNYALGTATGQIQGKRDRLFRRHGSVLKVDKNFFIEKENIKPRKDGQGDEASEDIIDRYYREFEKILGDEFLPV